MSVRIREAQGQRRVANMRKALALVAVLGAVGTFLTGLAAIINVMR